MKIKTLLAVVFCIMFMETGVYSADWGTVLKKIQKKYEMFDRDIKDMTMIQEIEAVTPQGKIITDMKVFKKGNMFRINVSMNIPGTPDGIENVVINDGKETWIISPFTGRKKLDGNESMQYHTESNWWKSISEKGKITGNAKIAGRACYIVEFEKSNDNPYGKLWLDKKELILIKGESEIAAEQDITWMYSNFKKMNKKWEIPYKTEVYSNDQLISTARMKSIEINKGIPATIFDPDKIEVKEMDIQSMMQNMMDNKNKDTNKTKEKDK